MFPIYHVFFGGIFSILVYLVFKVTFFEAFLIFFSSFLMDIDHYLWYIIKKRSINLKKAYNFFVERSKIRVLLDPKERKKYKSPILIFHGIEIMILCFILGFFYKFFWFILIGILFHLFLDYIDAIYHKDSIDVKFSQIYRFFKNKKLEDLRV